MLVTFCVFFDCSGGWRTFLGHMVGDSSRFWGVLFQFLVSATSHILYTNGSMLVVVYGCQSMGSLLVMEIAQRIKNSVFLGRFGSIY